MKLILGIIALFLAGGLILYYVQNNKTPEPKVTQTPLEEGEEIYTNADLGIMFRYLSGYVLKEPAPKTGEPTTILLVKKEDDVVRENSEGPTGITVQVFETGGESPDDWLKKPESNYQLASSTSVKNITVSGSPAISYHWSGLYEADTTVVQHDTKIVAVTVTYIEPTDSSRTAYTHLINSMQFFMAGELQNI